MVKRVLEPGRTHPTLKIYFYYRPSPERCQGRIAFCQGSRIYSKEEEEPDLKKSAWHHRCLLK
jgi:hypothetical protein